MVRLPELDVEHDDGGHHDQAQHHIHGIPTALVAAFSSGVAPYQVYLTVFGSGALVNRLMTIINASVKTNKIWHSKAMDVLKLEDEAVFCLIGAINDAY